MAGFTWVPMQFVADQTFVWKLSLYVTLLISLTFHEYGHAWSAKKLGDDTADLMGRLSLNPLVHLDPLFTVILPLYFIFGPGAGSGVFFCAAKPVPVNPFNLRKPTRDMMITSAAGPAMNVVLALFFTASYWFHIHYRGISDGALSSTIILRAIGLNLALCVFNMLPVPPLDGHRVLGYFLPANLRDVYYRFGYNGGFVVLLIMMFTGVLGRITGSILYPLGDWWGEYLMPGGITPFAYF